MQLSVITKAIADLLMSRFRSDGRRATALRNVEWVTDRYDGDHIDPRLRPSLSRSRLRRLIQVLLNPGKHLPDLLGPAEIGESVAELRRIDAKVRRRLAMLIRWTAHERLENREKEPSATPQ